MEKKVKEVDKEYKYAEELLCEKFDAKVRVFKNKFEIKFNDVDDLNRILEIMNVGK